MVNLGTRADNVMTVPLAIECLYAYAASAYTSTVLRWQDMPDHMGIDVKYEVMRCYCNEAKRLKEEREKRAKGIDWRD